MTSSSLSMAAMARFYARFHTNSQNLSMTSQKRLCVKCRFYAVESHNDELKNGYTNINANSRNDTYTLFVIANEVKQSIRTINIYKKHRICKRILLIYKKLDDFNALLFLDCHEVVPTSRNDGNGDIFTQSSTIHKNAPYALALESRNDNKSDSMQDSAKSSKYQNNLR